MTVLAVLVPVLIALVWRSGHDAGRRRRPFVYREPARRVWTVTDYELANGSAACDDMADALAMALTHIYPLDHRSTT